MRNIIIWLCGIWVSRKLILPEQIQKYRDGSDPDNYPNVNHLNGCWNPVLVFNTNIILAYKEEMLRRVYNLSVGYRNQEE